MCIYNVYVYVYLDEKYISFVWEREVMCTEYYIELLMITSKKSDNIYDALKRESGQWLTERKKANTHKQPGSQSGQATRFRRSKSKLATMINYYDNDPYIQKSWYVHIPLYNNVLFKRAIKFQKIYLEFDTLHSIKKF